MAFVILKTGIEAEDKDIVDSLKELVRKKIAAFAIPTAFLVCVVYLLHMHMACTHTHTCTHTHACTHTHTHTHAHTHTRTHTHTHTGCTWSSQNTLWQNNEKSVKENSS